jgi:hypothetical protein
MEKDQAAFAGRLGEPGLVVVGLGFAGGGGEEVFEVFGHGGVRLRRVDFAARRQCLAQ